ncbi:histidine-type phosphatase, partial [Caulobacter sp. S45]|uniref:histidine-type phosphatase n=1 Tax=Caulobacter sp. S45 TaxID=1641861 RepID=UPI00131D4B6C
TEEIGARAYARQPWPVWSTPPSLLTPHGREGMRQLGLYDRALFAAQGLLPADSCPGPGQASLWTNSEARTISSGEELAEGLAPGCQLAVDHLKPGEHDPLFDSAATIPDFDAAKAVGVINAETGGPAAIIAPHAEAIRTLETILGCRDPAHPAQACDLAAEPASLSVSADGHGVKLRGPIDTTSGTASVFMLEYLEGMPLAQVGWGRATPQRLAEVSRLHALLFDVFDRSSVMAHRTSAAMAPRIAMLLGRQDGPRVNLLVGHDNNIAALTAILGAHFQIPGYGLDDPPLGGALGFEVLKNARSGERYVRVFYQAQSADQLRALTPLSFRQPPTMQVLTPRCATGPQKLCRLEDVEGLLHGAD